MAPPEEVETQCPACKAPRPHQVKKGTVVKSGSGVEGTFTCLKCSHTHQGLVQIPMPVEIPLIVSRDAEAEPLAVQVLEEEEVRVGDEFEVEDALVEVTSIEIADTQRVRKAPAKNIKTLWGKDITQVKVAFGLNAGPHTRAFETTFDPDDTIGIGDKFDLDDMEVEAQKIITTSGRRTHGRHSVREIRRVWLKRSGSSRPVYKRPAKSATGKRPSPPPRKGAGKRPSGTGRGRPRDGPPRMRAGGQGRGGPKRPPQKKRAGGYGPRRTPTASKGRSDRRRR